MHLNSALLFQKYVQPLIEELAARTPKTTVRILEIGPDGFPSSFQRRISAQNISWETLDMFPRAGLTYLAESEYKFPIATDSFDLVFAGQVAEHVRKLWLWLPEVARVCKPGGTVATITPISWPYHEAPVDCWRIYPEGMRALYDVSGLTEVLLKEEALECAEFPELKWYQRLYAGVSCSNDQVSGRIRNVIKRCLLQPIPYANDLIAISRKEQS